MKHSIAQMLSIRFACLAAGLLLIGAAATAQQHTRPSTRNHRTSSARSAGAALRPQVLADKTIAQIIRLLGKPYKREEEGEARQLFYHVPALGSLILEFSRIKMLPSKDPNVSAGFDFRPRPVIEAITYRSSKSWKETLAALGLNGTGLSSPDSHRNQDIEGFTGLPKFRASWRGGKTGGELRFDLVENAPAPKPDSKPSEPKTDANSESNVIDDAIPPQEQSDAERRDRPSASHQETKPALQPQRLVNKTLDEIVEILGHPDREDKFPTQILWYYRALGVGDLEIIFTVLPTRTVSFSMIYATSKPWKEALKLLGFTGTRLSKPDSYKTQEIVGFSGRPRLAAKWRGASPRSELTITTTEDISKPAP